MICKGKEKYLFAMSGRAGSVPRPLPPLPSRGVGGGEGGGEWRAGSCLGILSGEGGILGQVNTVGCNGAYFWRVNSAG
jgi:hypothetical protein